MSTPEIKRQTKEAVDECLHFGARASIQYDEVYWSVSPRTDKIREKEIAFNYLKKVQSEAKNAEARYYERQQQITAYRAYQDQQEHQRRFLIAQQKARREEQQRQNAQRAAYYQREVKLPDSPDSLVVTWKEDSPASYVRRENKPVATKVSIKAPVELDITSNEVSSNGSFSFGTGTLQTLSLKYDLLVEPGASDKENNDSQTQLISQAPQKRSRDEIAPQMHISERSSSDMFRDSAEEPTQPYSCSETHNPLENAVKSPARKRALRAPFSPLS